jgi:hypothetical protein
MKRFRYGDELIPFTLRTQARRKSSRITIHVEPDGHVFVDAPEGTADEAVMAAMQRRAAWISSLRGRGASSLLLPREYVSGESWHYLGRQYQLKVVVDGAAHAAVRIDGSHIALTVDRHDAPAVRAALEAWYRARAGEVLAARLDAVAATLPWVNAVPALHLQAMRRQWGSCSPAGRVTLNPHLVKAPRECIDYVVLHELCHLIEHNHSPRFFELLDARMPGWREVKRRLDGLAGRLMP